MNNTSLCYISGSWDAEIDDSLVGQLKYKMNGKCLLVFILKLGKICCQTFLSAQLFFFKLFEII